MCILFIWYGPFLAASEATTASKQPQRSNLTSDLKSVTPITYLSMCILLIWFGPFWQPLRPLQPPNSLGGQNSSGPRFGLKPVCLYESARAKWAVSPESTELVSNASHGQMAPVCMCDSTGAKRAMSAASGASLAEVRALHRRVRARARACTFSQWIHNTPWVIMDSWSFLGVILNLHRDKHRNNYSSQLHYRIWFHDRMVIVSKLTLVAWVPWCNLKRGI